MVRMTNLALPDGCLAVFIDDAGHEALVEGRPVYGLGGCDVLVSERADGLIEKAFQDFGLEEDGKQLPIECYFMQKKQGEMALDVADFVMHAVGRQARQNLEKMDDFLWDFCAIFHTVDNKLVSFSKASSVRHSTTA
jgi:hypothetical protein